MGIRAIVEARCRFSFICRGLGEFAAPDRSQFVKIERLVRRDDVPAGGQMIVTLAHMRGEVNTPNSGIGPRRNAVGFRFA